MRKRPGLENQEVILLVGDWLVDEYWRFGVHRSSSASRTGDRHLRALHSPEGVVQAFCGAGRSAFFLHQVYRCERGDPEMAIVGAGFWHRDDTDALRSLFDPTAAPNNLFRLTLRVPPSLPPGVGLINMNDSWNSAKTDAYRDKYEYTTRIIRVYNTDPEGGGWTYDRLDWERPLRGVKWDDRRLAHLKAALSAKIGGRTIRAVVIKDMLKGTITREIVQWLKRVTPKTARWYVSSKKWNPEWLPTLRGVQLKLYMIPQVPAREAVRKQWLSTWLARSGKPSSQAIELIDKIRERTRAETIFVLPDEYSALVHSTRRRGSKCTVQSQPMNEKIAVDMGGASIAFPAMVACIEHEVPGSLEDLTSIALKATREWVDLEAQRILDHARWKPDHARDGSIFEALRMAVQKDSAINVGRYNDSQEMPWPPLREEWDQALRSDLGVIRNGQKREFQLWRSMLEIDGYVCCDHAKRKQLQKLVQGIRTFAANPKHHASCMLVAVPGTGKSYLAKRLADAAGLDFIAFNITQMQAKSDIIECFDIIRDRRDRRSRKDLLVFMDEINAPLDLDAPYSMFLTPLEDGSYVHSGRSIEIPPCAWVFAGTEKPPIRKTGKAKKLSDFVSRLTLGVFDLTRPATKQEAALERIYMGVALIRSEFSEVERISEGVLQAFHALPESARGRDIKNFVRRFTEIQYGQVTLRNVPDSDWPSDDKKGTAARKWRDRKARLERSIASFDEPNITIV